MGRRFTIHNVIIGAPFGNYLNFLNTTSTIGTFTLNSRSGWIKRLYKVLTTVRYYPRTQTWVNRLGLPNPGIDSVKNCNNKIISIHGFHAHEWVSLISYIEYGLTSVEAVEMNFSCPNVTATMISEAVDAAKYGVSRCSYKIIAKLPPLRWMEFGSALFDVGVRDFHLCNTIPTPGGGMSGKPLKQYSLWAIENFRQKWDNQVNLIGGGGITCMQDVVDYRQAGADRISLASMLFNPLNWWKVDKFVNYIKMVGK